MSGKFEGRIIHRNRIFKSVRLQEATKANDIEQLQLQRTLNALSAEVSRNLRQTNKDLGLAIHHWQSTRLTSGCSDLGLPPDCVEGQTREEASFMREKIVTSGCVRYKGGASSIKAWRPYCPNGK